MIRIAACAPNGVKIPSRRNSHDEIIDTFKLHMTNLRNKLLVRPSAYTQCTADPQ